MRAAWLTGLLAAVACAAGPDNSLDPTPDAAQDAPADAPPDAASNGFGIISGDCGVLDDAEWHAAQTFWFEGHFDFATDRYDDPADRDLLTSGGQIIVATDNAGGSSVYSEVFAFEWLARCEGATLIKSETQIIYDAPGKKVDILVNIDDRKVGVSVTRAVTYPFGEPYTLEAATNLFQRKLDDIQLATELVSDADAWDRQMLSILAYDAQHAAVALQAWQALSPQTRDDTILIVTITDGDDDFIYTDE
ncbi:MAG: hypothetical protein IPL79_10905 [Myxococcales bacterium]|nr:hypothetical protein [Myxococcales bacterium]